MYTYIYIYLSLHKQNTYPVYSPPPTHTKRPIDKYSPMHAMGEEQPYRQKDGETEAK